jgi:hypothetical protein
VRVSSRPAAYTGSYTDNTNIKGNRALRMGRHNVMGRMSCSSTWVCDHTRTPCRWILLTRPRAQFTYLPAVFIVFVTDVRNAARPIARIEYRYVLHGANVRIALCTEAWIWGGGNVAHTNTQDAIITSKTDKNTSWNGCIMTGSYNPNKNITRVSRNLQLKIQI